MGEQDKCAYCGAYPEDPWSREHVIPQGIGGNLVPQNPFVLSTVCEWCNTFCGRYIDGRFIRSWLTHNLVAVSWRYVDLSKNAPLPLFFFGTVAGVADHEGRQCDAWRGPAADHVYHFHHPYPVEPTQPIQVGRPLHVPLGEYDPGFVILFIGASNPEWHGTILHSVATSFKGAEVYLANGVMPAFGPFKPLPEPLITLRNELAQAKERTTSFPVDVAADHRFLAKAALGLGALFLDSSFLDSPDAKLLRDFMFCPSDERRSSIPLHGTPFLAAPPTDLTQILGWPDAHIIMLRPIGDLLALHLILFGTQSATVQVTTQRSHWQGHIDPEGALYVIVPGLHACADPVTGPVYIGWKHGLSKEPQLDTLKQRMDATPPLPPILL